jgi:hypothetical protein
MFTMGGASVGWQIGGKATDVVFLVMNPEGMKKLVQDSVKVGAELSVAAGPVGRSAEGATDVQLHAEILSDSRSRGLFGGASLDGAVYKQDEDDNQNVYGRRVTAKEILIDGTMPTPRAAQGLDSALTKYSPSGGRTFAGLRFMDAFNLDHQFEYQHLQQSANCSSPDDHTDRGQLQLAAERRRVSDRRHPDHSDAYPLPAGNRHHQHHELGQLRSLYLWWNWDSRSHGGHGRDLHRWSSLRDDHLHPCLGLWRAVEKIDSVFSSSAKT